jgi:hypothetical protein
MITSKSVDDYFENCKDLAKMALPVHPLTLPASLAGMSNGKLPSSILESVPGQEGGAPVTLVKPAARAWRALAARALEDGHVLKVNTAGRSYRSYAEKEAIFRARYYKTISGRVWWDRRLWKKRSGVAIAARPGTSNHGWGLAVDAGEERDGDISSEPFDAETLTWLKIHAHSYGFSWELQSEPWHLRYWAGDDIPQAVILYELANTPIIQEEDQEMQLINDTSQKKSYAGWIGPDGFQYIRAYNDYVNAGTPMPNISYVIQEQVDKGNIKLVK